MHERKNYENREVSIVVPFQSAKSLHIQEKIPRYRSEGQLNPSSSHEGLSVELIF
jgi:hypothetical protein